MNKAGLRPCVKIGDSFCDHPGAHCTTPSVELSAVLLVEKLARIIELLEDTNGLLRMEARARGDIE